MQDVRWRWCAFRRLRLGVVLFGPRLVDSMSAGKFGFSYVQSPTTIHLIYLISSCFVQPASRPREGTVGRTRIISRSSICHGPLPLIKGLAPGIAIARSYSQISAIPRNDKRKGDISPSCFTRALLEWMMLLALNGIRGGNILGMDTPPPPPKLEASGVIGSIVKYRIVFK